MKTPKIVVKDGDYDIEGNFDFKIGDVYHTQTMLGIMDPKRDITFSLTVECPATIKENELKEVENKLFKRFQDDLTAALKANKMPK